MPDPNEPSLIIDSRMGSLLVSASGRLDAIPAESRGAPLKFGAPAAEGEAGTLGPYRLLRELGRGGMGAVFLALDTRLDRKLALKVMLPEFAADAEAKERFLREAKAAAKIGHDNVVTVFEADERDGVAYIAMQLLQGYPLDAFIQKKGKPSLRHAARIAREAALGLAAAHKLGVVHRDVKPANLWLETPHGRVKLLDFGLARPDNMDTGLTKSGVLIGTPAFMSPEQALGEHVDHRTDLFSLGAVLYWLCTGRLPFPGASVVAVLKALGTEEPQPVLSLNPRVPQPLAELIHRLLAKAPDGRPQSATEVANRLHEILGQSAGLSPAAPGGAADSSGAQGGDADPWTTLAKSAASQQAGPAPVVTNEPQVLRSQRVVVITDQSGESQEEQEEAQKPAPGGLRTVISSGVLWEESGTSTQEEQEEKKAEAKRPDRPKRKLKPEEEEEDEEEEEEARARRRDRPRRRRANGKKNSSVPVIIGIGAVALIAVSVVVTLLVVSGRQKGTESAQTNDGDYTPVIPGRGEDPPPAPPLPGFPVTPPAAAPRSREPTILGGLSDPPFKDLAPEGGLLVGMEFGLGKYIGDDVIQAGRPIYRVGDEEVLGAQRGTNLTRVVTIKAKDGYAVGAITCKYGLNFDGCSLTFMRVAAGKLDPRDSYESTWVGYDGPKRTVKLGGDGTPIVGIAGKASDKQMFGLGPLFRGQEAWEPSTRIPSAPPKNPALTGKYGASEVVLGARSGTEFRDESPPGGLLVGFDAWCGLFVNYEVIDGVRPIYRTDGKDTFGGLCGRETTRAYRVLAKPGYAVGGLIVKAGLGTDSLVVVFMRVKGDRLDPDDSYQSEKIGGPGGGTHPMLGGDGTPVTGVIGRLDKTPKLSGLGLAFAKK